jgi:hypothetical protein
MNYIEKNVFIKALVTPNCGVGFRICVQKKYIFNIKRVISFGRKKNCHQQESHFYIITFQIQLSISKKHELIIINLGIVVNSFLY